MVSAIQPITNFSTLLPATAVSPPELLSVASDFVTTHSGGTVVTLGETQPASQPVFDSSGHAVAVGTTTRTPQSQALANDLLTALGSSTLTFVNTTTVINALNGAASIPSRDLAALALEMNLIDAANLNASGLLNSASTTDFSGVLAAQIELAVAGIGTGNGSAATTGTVTSTAAVNALLTTPAAVAPTATPATATVAPATVPAAIAPTVTAPPAVAPTATAPAAAVAAATVPIATAPPALTVPIAPVATAATAVTTATAGLTPADVLQQLLADVTGRAIANLKDAGFASTSAALFASAAVFRAAQGPAPTSIGTADIAGNPPFEVTAVQSSRTT